MFIIFFAVTCAALLFYDYFITLPLETSRYWRTPATTPNVLFFVNRYGMLLGHVPVVFMYFWLAEPTERKLTVRPLHITSRVETAHSQGTRSVPT